MPYKWVDPDYPEENTAFREEARLLAERRKEEMRHRRHETVAQINEVTITDPVTNIVRQIISSYVAVDGGTGPIGYISCGNNLTKEQVETLLDACNIKDKRALSYGDCKDCRFSEDGRERGYRWPCVGCMRPQHDYFQPKDLTIDTR